MATVGMLVNFVCSLTPWSSY